MIYSQLLLSERLTVQRYRRLSPKGETPTCMTKPVAERRWRGERGDVVLQSDLMDEDEGRSSEMTKPKYCPDSSI